MDGKQLGIVSTDEARAIAAKEGLDLVEIAPNERPPVCRVMDYSKFKYEQQRRVKGQKHSSVDWKETQLSPVISDHDIQTKTSHLRRWLEKGKHVRVVVEFAGRQLAHLDQGRAVMQRVLTSVEDIAKIEGTPKMEGKRFIASLAPLTK